MFRANVAAVVLFMVLVGLVGGLAVSTLQSSASQAQPTQESWQKEFEEVCSKTDDAMTFSQEELTDLIRKCDKLQPQIEKLDESRRKVYLGRLRMCRGLYAYVLEAKKNEKK
jgi:peptidoglycan hydrolase CwlO-like protein